MYVRNTSRIAVDFSLEAASVMQNQQVQQL